MNTPSRAAVSPLASEVNFDGLIGPSHHYAGHSFGNVASTLNRGALSRPREAALQGLQKAKALHDLGLKQGVLPPPRRPRADLLHRLGFRGSDEAMIEAAYRADPQLLSGVYSASSVGVATAATVSPSADTDDGKVHFTAANLAAKFHRSIEAGQTATNLRRIFPAGVGHPFVHHEGLPGALGDEGAANHGRLTDAHGTRGLEVFVYGRALAAGADDPRLFPARQVREASEAVARLHGVSEKVFLRQSSAAIDAGVFHNDVISVTNENVFFMHEQAFADRKGALAELRAAWRGSRELQFVEVRASEVSLAECVQSYLFNSQLVTLPSGKVTLICPRECEETPAVKRWLDANIGNGPISELRVFDLRQSMRNGGGPACLRLRVVLTDTEWNAVLPAARLDDARFGELSAWVSRNYREELAIGDLRDPQFYRECMTAFDELRREFGGGIA